MPNKKIHDINTKRMKIEKTLDKNVNFLKSTLNSEDVTFLDLKIGNKNAVIVFINDLVDKNSVGELILRPASQTKGELDKTQIFELFLSPEKTKVTEMKDLINDLLLGNTILITDQIDCAFSFGLKFFEKRAITEPPHLNGNKRA